MANKDHDKFDDFVKKILDLQKEKEEESLSEEALWDIAQAMGLQEGDLDTAKQNYLIRGKQHLEHNNWQNAIKEFEELLTISPKNLEGTFGLALAYDGLWQQHHNETDKQQALKFANKATEISPDYKPAYKLISRLQNGSKKTHSYSEFDDIIDAIKNAPGTTTTTTSTSTTITKTQTGKKTNILLTLLPVVFVLSVVGYNLRGFIFGVPQRTTVMPQQTKLIATNKGLVCWIVEQGLIIGNGGMSHTYTAKIVNPATGRRLARVKIAKGLKITSSIKLLKLKDQVLVFNREQAMLELRDAYTGKMVEDLKKTLSALPELIKGIGIIEQNGYWFKITSEDDRVYYYSPYFKKLVKRIDGHRSIEDYIWVTKRQGHSVRFSLMKTLVSPKKFNTEKKKQSYSSGGKLVGQSKRKFINAAFLYGNQYFCVILHDSGIGKNAKKMLTAIDRNGKVMWENLQPKSVILSKGEYTNHVAVWQSVTHDNIVAIHAKGGKNGIVGIDTKTGKVAWEYEF